MWLCRCIAVYDTTRKTMSKKHKVIHDSDFTLIGDFFKALDRQGPCSEEATLKALSFIEELPADAKIVDAGCGTGGQTITLAKNTTGHITAIDLMPAFIESLQQAVKWESLADRITPVTGSMGELPFDEQ